MATLKNTTVSDTGAIQLPVGTTAQRPGSPSVGQMRYNSTFKTVESYDGTRWKYTPDIVRNGLVLHLDAAEPSSYPGSGTTWYDLSGNGNNGTLINGPTYSSSNGGVIVTDGVDDYIDISLNLTNQDYTIIGSARYVTIGGRTFSAKNNNWLMGQWSSSTVKHYAVGWVTDSVNNEQSDTNWRIYAATGKYSEDTWAFYVNGQIDTPPNNGGSNGPNGFAIGCYLPGNSGAGSEFSNSQIGNLLAYNRVLTPKEIKQNYEALRGRFGL